MDHFLFPIILEINHHSTRAWFGHDTVEGDYYDACIRGLLNRSIQCVRRGSIDDNSVIALKNQVLDLRGLGWAFLVSRSEHICRCYDAVSDRFLGHNVIAAADVFTTADKEIGRAHV